MLRRGASCARAPVCASSSSCLSRTSTRTARLNLISSMSTKAAASMVTTIASLPTNYKIEALPSFLSLWHAPKDKNVPASTTDFHYQWLRHNCNCSPGCLHPKTKERIVNVTDINHNIRPKHLKIVSGNEGDELSIDWDDGHLTKYPVKWLTERAYSIAHSKSSIDTLSVSQGNITVPWSDKSPKRLLEILQKYGALVVTGGPAKAEDTLKIVHSLFSKNLVETHFGLIEDLRTDNTTNKNNDQLGYTDAPVDLHTDQPFIARPPSMQLLHCIQSADVGADALAVARFLKQTDESAYHYLTRVPITFHRKQQSFESIHHSPIIRVDENDVRFSYFTLAPLSLPFNKVEPWYRAYRLFTELVYNPRFKYQFLLRPGDFVLYDNFRMLHARTGFKGARWMRGIYVERDDVYNHLSNPSTSF